MLKVNYFVLHNNNAKSTKYLLLIYFEEIIYLS